MTTTYSAVTVVDIATSVGLDDATAYLLDYRFFDASFPVSFIGSNSSVGTGDSIGVYVSPDARKNVAGTYAQIESFTTTAFTGVIQGTWGGIKFVKRGAGGTGRVIALMNGYTISNRQIDPPAGGQG